MNYQNHLDHPPLVTRFAPSPTGYLHLGSARTALYNWLYTRRLGGTFHLRIEDTDQARSTQAAVDAIIDGLRWLGLDWDGEIVFQSRNAEQHRQVAEELVAAGHAYRCYLTPEEIEASRQQHGGHVLSPWRQRDSGAYPAGRKYTIRLKSKITGATTLSDLIKGQVTVNHSEIDDMVLLRSDATPTYMLAVVVDDHTAGVNLVIRGDDHFTNTFRQLQLYDALGWPIPQYAHIPMINSADGSKMSKRHGAVGIEQYRTLGYLPEALRNYLLRLGWGGDGATEIYNLEQAIAAFDIHKVSSSPARFDFDKLNSLNSHYIRHTDDRHLLDLILDHLPPENLPLGTELETRLLNGMLQAKQRAVTLPDLARLCSLYLYKSQPIDQQSAEILDRPVSRQSLSLIYQHFSPSTFPATSWTTDQIKAAMSTFATINQIKPGEIIRLLRAAVLGTFNSPGVYEIMEVIGQEESLSRIAATIASAPASN